MGNIDYVQRWTFARPEWKLFCVALAGSLCDQADMLVCLQNQD